MPDGAAECPQCYPSTVAVSTATAALPAIPGYLLLYALGEGGMGTVYLAQDLTLGRSVAIKFVSEKLAQDTETRARFLREARAMASVEHPHVVRVHAFGDAAGQAYIVMEYVEGETLADRIKRLGRIAPEEAFCILRQTVGALEAAWEKHIIHRDIKPSNILVDRKNQVRVGDFGLAKPIEAEGDASLTNTGMLLGTPHYISPEQAQGHAVDFRADIYSLGIVLYEMLTGERPFQGTTPVAIVAKHLHTPIPSLRERYADIPEGMVQLVEWMTEKDPGKRPATYAALGRRIEAASTGDVARMTSPVAPPAPAIDAASKRGSLIRSLVVAVLIGILAWVWFVLLQPQPIVSSQPKERRLVVAVAPFYGPDEDSVKEGKVMAALVEKAITDRLGSGDVKVLGIDETKAPVRSHDAARALGQSLGAGVVIWGEAFTLRGETEIQPYFTMVASKEAPATAPERAQEGEKRNSLAELESQSAQPVRMEATAPNQIELRKTSAAGIGDVVFLLAGLHALYTEGNAQKALAFFSKAPRTADSLRYRAQTLLRLGKKEDARAALEQAVALDAHDAQSFAMLGDFLMQESRLQDAVSAYRSAAQSGHAFTTTEGLFYDGKLYAKETVRSLKYTAGEAQPTLYLLAVDPVTGKVLERYLLPGPLQSMSVTDDAVHISYQIEWSRSDRSDLTFSHGKFDRTIFLPASLPWRAQPMRFARAPAANFTRDLDKQTMEDWSSPPTATFIPTSHYQDVPQTFGDLESALKVAIERDPTQPWYVFLIGQAYWAQGRKQEAAELWKGLFGGAYPAIPYYEYALMASYFERFNQHEWADRAFQETLRRRKQLAQPIEFSLLIERHINTGFFRDAAWNSRNGLDPQRAYLWLERERELTGICPEGDDFAAAAWGKYFREHGENRKAEVEKAYFEKVQRFPLNAVRTVTLIDYVFYGLVASLVSFLILFTALIKVTPGGENLEPARWPAAVLSAALGLVLVCSFMILLSLVIGNATLLFLFLGIILALFGTLLYSKSTIVRRRIESIWRIVGWMLAVAAPLAMNLFYTGGRGLGQLLNMYGAMVCFLFLVAALMSSRGFPLHARLAGISKHERFVLGVSWSVLVFFLLSFLLLSNRILPMMELPTLAMDSIGHEALVHQLEDKLKESDTPEIRYATAVVNHMAGHAVRAKQLYATLAEDTRVKENVKALGQGSLVPPVPLTIQDLNRVFSHTPAGHWFDPLWRYDRLAFFSTGDFSWTVVAVPYVMLGAQVAVLIGMALWIGFALVLARSRPENQETVPAGMIRKWSRKVAFLLIPGLFDLRHSRPSRGYLALFFFVLAVLVALIQSTLMQVYPAPGLATDAWQIDILTSYPFPMPQSFPNLTSAAAYHYCAAYHYWTLFWSYPYAKVFWSVVAVGALLSLCLHALNLRRIWRGHGM